jgi:hypothetical protein
MPRKNQQTVRQSLGNPFPHLPLIQSKDDEPAESGIEHAFDHNKEDEGTEEPLEPSTVEMFEDSKQDGDRSEAVYEL